MAVSMSGLASGLDTETIIQQLVSAYSIKKDNLVKEQTKLEWKQDAWKELNSKIYSFYTGLDKMRFTSGYSLKKAASTSSKASVTASADAVNGTQTLKIKSTASSGYLTGGKLDGIVKDGKTSKIKGDTKLSDMGISEGSSISVNVNGKERNINITSKTTVNSLIVSLKEAGVSANFDETNQRFFISSKKSGEAYDFSLTSNNAEGADALSKLGLMNYSAKDIQSYRDLAAMDVTAKADAAYEKKKTKYTDATAQKKALENEVKTLKKNITSLEKNKKYADMMSDYANNEYDGTTVKKDSVQAQIDELNARESLTDEEKENLSDLKLQLKAINEVDAKMGDDTLTDEDRDKIKSEFADNAASISDKLTESREKLANDEDILADETGAKLNDYVADRNDEIDDKNAALKESLVDFYTKQRDEAAAKVAAYDTYYDVYSSYSSIESPTAEQTQAYNEAKAALGITGSMATRIEGKDAVIELNGAEFTSNTNDFSINGLTISVNAATAPDEEIQLTTSTDVDGLYDKIREFFSDYNSLINEMDSLYNADSAKGYEPLTDDEKSVMTENDIELWETKIKDSILRRDSTLDSVSNLMKTAFMQTFNIDGKNYSLSSFGIKTGGYFSTSDNSKSAYHIDGDEDDSLTSSNSDKLRKALTSDPDTFVTFFTKLTQNIYEKLDKKMKSTTLNSAYTVYHDKTMKNEYNDYKDKISDWEDRIAAYEERYRKQFTAMETALSKLNSNTSFITSMLG